MSYHGATIGRAYRQRRRARGLCMWCPQPARHYLCQSCAVRRAAKRNAKRAAAKVSA
jgi:hypothetical protein